MFGKSRITSYQLGWDNAYMEEGNQNPYSKEKELDLWLDYENGYRDGLKELEEDMR